MENPVKKTTQLSPEEKRQFTRNFIKISQIYGVPKLFRRTAWEACKYIESNVLSKLPSNEQ